MVSRAVLLAMAAQRAVAVARAGRGVANGQRAVLADDGGIEIDQVGLGSDSVRIVTSDAGSAPLTSNVCGVARKTLIAGNTGSL